MSEMSGLLSNTPVSGSSSRKGVGVNLKAQVLHVHNCVKSSVLFGEEV